MLYMRMMDPAGATALFRPFARSRHLELDPDGVVWRRAVDQPDRFVPEVRLGPILGRCDVPGALQAELAALRARWLARDRLEDLAAEARQRS
jgi:hypothetical protein